MPLSWARALLARACPSRRRPGVGESEVLLGASHPSSSPPAAGPTNEDASRATVVVAADAVPGISKVSFQLAQKKVDVTVPKAAGPGDTLTLRQESSGGWRLDISKSSNARAPRKLRAVVPADAEPGSTEVFVDTLDGRFMKIVVPGNAAPGNMLMLTRGDSASDWNCEVEIMKHNLTPPEPRDKLNEVAAYLALRDKAEAAGAKWVAHLMRRAATEPGQIAGMMTLADVAEGTELGRVPRKQFLTREAVRQHAPELSTAVEALLPLMPSDQRSLPLQVAFLTKLLQRAEARAGLQIRPQFATAHHPVTGVDMPALWSAYADALVGETLPDHPYRWALQDPVAFRRAMAPSPEGALVEALAAGILIRYEVIVEHLGYDLLGAAFSAERFLRAWLLIISRSFELEGARETLIPHMDGFNHAAKGKENARVRWSEEAETMIVEATRDIAEGEEVLFFYDANSNPMLFRTYGFTLPVLEEPNWTCLSPPTTSQKVLQAYFPKTSPWRGKMIEFTSAEVHATLRGALHACREAGNDPESFLRDLLVFRLEPYLQDAELQPCLDPLDPGKACEAAAHDEAVTNLGSPGRVKLSEYLCLAVYQEAHSSLSSRTTPEEQQLAEPGEGKGESKGVDEGASKAAAPSDAAASVIEQLRARRTMAVARLAAQLREAFSQSKEPS